MVFEHDQERSLIEGLEDALRTKNNPKYVLFVNRLTARVRNHIHNEESVLFPIAEAMLSKDQDKKVAAEFAKYEIDPNLRAELHRLEWKYMRRRTAAGSGK
jgi:hemerythrin-like domain-containing protein